LIDDEGSGYAIGRDILSVAVRSYDKRSGDSILLPMVLKTIGGTSIQDIIQYTYQAASKKEIAALAPLLSEALLHQDKEAAGIASKAAGELVKLVLPVAKQLQLEQGEIALSGGILHHCMEIRQRVEQGLTRELPKFKIVEARYDSASGAAFIALKESRKRGINHG
jgi:N-acetylglucosamine kinase-like BadF-type ATPase